MHARRFRQPPFDRIEHRLPPPVLLRVHRHSMMNVLLVGGSEPWRARLAETVHRESPVHEGPLVRVDGRREEEQLACALLGWIGSTGVDHGAHTLRAASRGTLFVDWITCLSEGVQRLLLTLALREPTDLGGGVDAWCGRIVAGSSVDPATAVAHGSFSAELFDALDKIRIQHRPLGTRGVTR